MVNVLNDKGNQINIVHFQGNSLQNLSNIFKIIYDNVELNKIDKNISIVSCWTNLSKCYLYYQLNKFGMNLINALPDDYDYSKHWDMRNKIKFYIDCLKTKISTKYVILLDGYDVLFASTDNILKKFKNSGYKIIFNTSSNNFPDEEIDIIQNRDKLGFFKYFNAGCCIGYREELIKFYEECLEYFSESNNHISEQMVVRKAFAKYSNNPKQRFIWLDKNRDIFHTMMGIVCDYDQLSNTIQLINNTNYKGNIKITGTTFKSRYSELLIRDYYDSLNKNTNYTDKLQINLLKN